METFFDFKVSKYYHYVKLTITRGLNYSVKLSLKKPAKLLSLRKNHP